MREESFCQSDLSSSEKNFFVDDQHNNNSGSIAHESLSQSSGVTTKLARELSSSCMPQWNGIKIQHPMDPRIDLSTVGFMGETSQLYSLAAQTQNNNSNNNAIIANSNNNNSNNNNTFLTSNIDSNNNDDNGGMMNEQNLPPNSNESSSASSPFPCVEQYTKLLEVRSKSQYVQYDPFVML